MKTKIQRSRNRLYLISKNPKFVVGMGAYIFQDNSGDCLPLTIIDVKGEVGNRTITFQKDDTVISNWTESLSVADYEIGYERNSDNELFYIQEKNFLFGKGQGWIFQVSFMNPFTKKLNLDLGRICIGERQHETPQPYHGLEKDKKRFS